MESLKEILQFLHPDQRLDLKAVSLTHILGLTGSKEGKEIILSSPETVEAILKLTSDKMQTIAKDAVLALINLIAEENGAKRVSEICEETVPPFQIIHKALSSITDKDSELSDPWSMVISNLTRLEQLAEKTVNELESNEEILQNLLRANRELLYNKKDCKLDYLGPIFCNLTQTAKGRALFCTNDYEALQRIVAFTSYEQSIVRKGGAIGVLKNICFDPCYHHLILNDNDDEILCRILYPLIGPEEFSEEENEKLPMELQYISEEKKREEDPDLRVMLLECLLQLCATKKYREFLRSKGVYEILREYHKWEAYKGKEKEALLTCEKVVDILIKKEDEINLDNLKQIEVPDDLSKKFQEDDENFLME